MPVGVGGTKSTIAEADTSAPIWEADGGGGGGGGVLQYPQLKVQTLRSVVASPALDVLSG